MRKNPIGRVSSTLETADLAPGDWQVSVTADDAPIEDRAFKLQGRP